MPLDPSDNSTAGRESPAASTYGEDSWHGAGFAASWISPPAPHRGYDDPTLPQRGDDHA
jgi:hypothetical protein